MTIFVLERAETDKTAPARVVFRRRVAGSGEPVFLVSHEEYYVSTGWASTMGKGDGVYDIKRAREFYRGLLSRGYVAT